MFVSIIIPMRNEEKFVGKCLDSFLRQIKGRQDVEIFCVDGMSTDRTREIVQQYRDQDSRIRLIENPRKIVSAAMNLGIAQSRGDFVMVAGCHAEYAPDYVDKCLEVLDRTGADKVGGYLTTAPSIDTSTGRAIAAATSSKFGVGSGARAPGPEREAVQAAFGGFRRDVFDRFGFYDERLVRNQDLEMACRIHKGGGKCIISPEIQVTYYNRSTFAGLRNQAFLNGLWNPYTIWIVRGGVRLKHFVPLLFVLSILILGLAGFAWPAVWLVLIFELLVYCVIGLLESFRLAGKARTSGFLVFLAFVQLHLSYGLGSAWGVLTAPFKFVFVAKQPSSQALEEWRSSVQKHSHSHNRMFTYARIVLKFVQHHSWLELAKRIWIAATKKLFEGRSMLIMRLRPEDAAEPDPRLRIRELTPSDIDHMLAVMYLSRADICGRFGRGERCFAILDGQDIRTYFWVQFSVRELDRLYLRVNLDPNQAWFYNAITVKSARGRGYYTNIIRYMVNRLKAEGFDEFFIDVEERNLASIRGTEKAGSKRIARVQMKRTLSQARYRLKILDKNSWQKLSKQISNFPRAERVFEEAVDER